MISKLLLHGYNHPKNMVIYLIYAFPYTYDVCFFLARTWAQETGLLPGNTFQEGIVDGVQWRFSGKMDPGNRIGVITPGKPICIRPFLGGLNSI